MVLIYLLSLVIRHKFILCNDEAISGNCLVACSFPNSQLPIGHM